MFDFLNDASFRATVKREHQTMAALFNEYIAGLRGAYASEIGTRVSGR
jgi:hypothetical protein